jgi:hypothetical protein
LRARCERIRGELSSSLTAGQIKVAESQAIEKSMEAWAQEILK